MEKSFSALGVNNTIHISYGDDHINIQKEPHPELFDRVFKLLVDNKIEEVKRRFFEFKKDLERYTEGNFYYEGNKIRLKGDEEEIPALLAKKLLAVREAEEEYMPLIRFWKKLKENPDPNVREQLYAFLSHNHIPITENGDVLCEKGVQEKACGTLVDCYTQTIDNSIGMVVEVDRSTVDSDPNRTCSHGLHVGAPDYVRKWWTSGIIIEVIVNPRDFVAVPKDYNETKARVCRYQVIGLASSSPRKKLIYKFEDIIAPTYGAMEAQKKRDEGFDPNKAQDHSSKPADKLDYTKMTAQAIIDYVKSKTGKTITGSLKNKKSIIAKAERILAEPTAPAPSSEVFEAVKAIIAEHMDFPANDITLTTSFTNHIGADDLDMVELVMEYEKDFNIAISDDDMESIRTVADAVACIEREIARTTPANSQKALDFKGKTAAEIVDAVNKITGGRFKDHRNGRENLIDRARKILKPFKYTIANY